MANSNAPQYDIIIVGAGMVGAAAACLLAQSNTTKKVAPLKIALIESSVATPFDADQFGRLLRRCVRALIWRWTYGMLKVPEEFVLTAMTFTSPISDTL
jgi:flavin-dependent dehydrogenase